MKNLLFLIVFVSLSFAQIPHQISLARDGDEQELIYYEGLMSNSVVDIREGGDNLIVFGTSGGIGFAAIQFDGSLEFYSIDSDSLPVGGNPGLAVKDSVIAVSGASSVYSGGEYHPAGSGIAYSLDSGITWNYKPQPVDPLDSPKYLELEWGGQQITRLAITTEINNVSYDLAILGDYIYSTSWAGGLQRFQFRNYLPVPDGENPNPWQPLPLPMDDELIQYCGFLNTQTFELNPNDPGNGGSHNHKGFSVYAVEDTLWVGTAGGINKGIVHPDGCIDWQHYTSANDGISGNWVVGFTHQVLNDDNDNEFIRLSAATWSTNSSETYALSYTDDGGATWNVPERIEELGLKVYSLSSNGDELYAPTDGGLYISQDMNIWDKYRRPEIPEGQEVLSDIVYSAMFLPEYDELVVGTPDGVAVTGDDGLSWEIFRFWIPTEISSNDEERFYAYPNPFYVNDANFAEGDGHVRFVFNGFDGGKLKLHIYDFAMEQVIDFTEDEVRNTGVNDQREFIWDGKNDWGDKVANGVYFCRLTLANDYYWTKLLVIN